MDGTVVYSTKSGEAAGNEIIDRIGRSEPDCLLLFPTTGEVTANGIDATVETLCAAYDCPVVGASIGGFATAESDGLELFGTAAIALNDVSVDRHRVPDVWNADQDSMRSLLDTDAGTTITFEPGSRAGSNTAAWNTAKRIANHVIQRDTLNQRKRLIKKISDVLASNRIGYSALFRARIAAGRDGAHIVNFDSGDTGDFLNGYEIWNDTITRNTAGTVLRLNQELETGYARTAAERLTDTEPLETFETLESHGHVIYAFDGETLADIKDRYAIGQKVGRGAFAYYFILETQNWLFAVPIPDLNILVSYAPIDDSTRAHLVRAPSFDEYRTAYSDMLSGIGSGLPHISINQPQMDCFQKNIADIVTMTKDVQDTFLITVDNAFRQYDAPDYNFPGYVLYK